MNLDHIWMRGILWYECPVKKKEFKVTNYTNNVHLLFWGPIIGTP